MKRTRSGREVLLALSDPSLEHLLLAMWTDVQFPFRPVRSRAELEGLLPRGHFGGIVLDLDLWSHPPVERWSSTTEGGLAGRPVLLVVPSEARERRAALLAAGASDVLSHPVEVVELYLRLQARLRQIAPGPRPEGIIRLGPWVLDFDRSEWRDGDRVIHLTPLEQALMGCLLETPGRVVPMERLLAEGLGHAAGQGSPEAVRNHVRNLRRKLERHPRQPEMLRNIPGVGYMLQLPVDQTLHQSFT
ncbi:MAG: winged helix-turn-helix domain-containing protein [Candidatus Sericytochromatia bacterium]|nr:winged helix-turn-helix domain-containing protein [Candidatus Sericytochromatia bacterium]